MKARPGILKHRVRLEVNAPAASDYGENAESWSTLETVWASVEPVSASEQIRAGMAVGTITHRLRLRYREDFGSGDVPLGTKHRALYDGRYFEIVGVREADRRRYLDVTAREVAAE